MNAKLKQDIYPDAAGVSLAAAEKIVALAEDCVKKTGRFTIALSGGSTPKNAYALMVKDPLMKRMPWHASQFYFGDERHVRPDHPDSNFRMAYESMLHAVPTENVFPIPTADPDVNRCAESYESLLRAKFDNSPWPIFDLILLGLGPDGHTASLFPGTPAANEMTRWVTWSDPAAFNPSIKPPVKRVTITKPVIWNSANVFVLATGPEKKPILAKIFSESEPPDPPVSRLLRECKGNVEFFVDRSAVE